MFQYQLEISTIWNTNNRILVYSYNVAIGTTLKLYLIIFQIMLKLKPTIILFMLAYINGMKSACNLVD